MAVTQYIGARYVPKFFTNSDGTEEWRSGVEYEPLTIVTYNQNSYTSKKPVPSFIGNPSDNHEYWVATGNYNAQVEIYRQEVQSIKDNLAFVSVKSYGATGNGVEDDTEAFQAAFATGKNIYIPEGEYLLTDIIPLNSNTTILCDGLIIDRQEEASAANWRGLFYGNAVDHVKIAGLRIKGVGASTQSYTYGGEIHFKNSNNIIVYGCEIYDVLKNHAIVFETCDSCIADSNYVHQYTQAGISLINVCNDCKVINNTLIDVTGTITPNSYPIMLNGYTYPITSVQTVGQHNICTGNYINNSYPWYEGIDAHGGVDFVISNNIVRNTYSGIVIAGDTNYPAAHILIENNIIVGAVEGTRKNADNCGIAISNTSYCNVTGNLLRRWGKLVDHTVRNAVYVVDSDYIKFNDNILNDNGDVGTATAGSMLMYFVNTANVSIQNNTIENNMCVRSIRVTGTGNNYMITGNIIKNSGIPQIDTSDAAPHQFIYRNNELSDYAISNYNYILPDRVPFSQIVNVHAGNVGDIIINNTAGSGQAIGWVCSASQTASANATWKRSFSL